MNWKARKYWEARREEGFVFDATDDGIATIEDDSGNLNEVALPFTRDGFSSDADYLDAIAEHVFEEDDIDAYCKKYYSETYGEGNEEGRQ
jgi:hypothetical protein